MPTGSRARRPGVDSGNGAEQAQTSARTLAPSATQLQKLPDVPAAALLLRDSHAAVLLGMSVRTLHARVAAGLVPLPVRCGRLVRWRRAELEAFVLAGCPPRTAWAWPGAARERHA